MHDPTDPSSPIAKTCSFLSGKLLSKYTPPKQDSDSVIDVRAVLQQSRQSIGINDLPSVLLPHKGKFQIQDYEKVFTDEASYGFGFGEIYRNRNINREKGCIVIVRPDQFVSAVLPLSDEGDKALEEFFDGFIILQQRSSTANGH